MKNKHLISPMDFSKEELNEIFELAEKIISNPKEFSHICDGQILATLFYEPSTRTRFSFEAAMMRLGENLGFSEPNQLMRKRWHSRHYKNGFYLLRYNAWASKRRSCKIASMLHQYLLLMQVMDINIQPNINRSINYKI